MIARLFRALSSESAFPSAKAPMIRRLLARLLPGRPTRDPRIYRAERASGTARSGVPRRTDGHRKTAGSRLPRVHRRRRRPRPAARPDAEGLRHRDRRHAGTGQAAVPARVHHRPPLSPGARACRRRSAGSVDVSRAAEGAKTSTDEHGRLLSDNVYGTQDQDAARRDFTINALYFDPSTEEVWDYVGGVTDMRARRLKLIGPPVTRFREDPVRMLRAVRLAAKAGFTIDPKTAAPIAKLASLIQNVPPARLFDEMQKLLLSGHAVETLKSLRTHGLSHGLLPLLDVILEQPLGPSFIEVALAGTDRASSRRQARVAGVPVCHAAVARSAAAMEHREGTRRETAAGAVRRDGPRAAGAGANASRFRAASRPRSRKSGRCSRASSSARAPGRFACSSTSAFAPRTTSSRCAASPAKCGMALVDWWTRFQDADEAERATMLQARRSAEESAAARAAAAASGARMRTPATRRRVRRVRRVVGPLRADADSRLHRTGQQPRPSAPAARARGARRCARLPRSRLVALSPNYVTAPLGLRAAAARLRECGGARSHTSLAPRALLAQTAGDRAPAARRRDAGVRATHRGRSISICYYTAAAGSTPRSSPCRIRGCTNALSCCGRLLDIAPAVTIPGRGLARRHWSRACAASGSRVRAPTFC